MCKMESLGPTRLQVAESKSIKWYFSMYVRKSNILQKPNSYLRKQWVFSHSC